MRTVAVLAWDGVVATDATTPAEVLGRAATPTNPRPYQVVLVTPQGPASTGFATLHGTADPAVVETADTVVVPGRHDLDRPTPSPVIDTITAAAARGTRIASICTGAFTLAEAGLLDRRRATTHWAATTLLARRHPAVQVDVDALVVDEGDVLTSAGASAGIDLCLHLIRRDLGEAAAAEAARWCVVPLIRDGGQAQFISPHSPPQAGSGFADVLAWIEARLDRPLSIAVIAKGAHVSPRSLNRRFHDQLGTTPMRWVRERRVRQAQILLEATDRPVERIATDIGFSSPSSLRDAFADIVGTAPQRYRQTFRDNGSLANPTAPPRNREATTAGPSRPLLPSAGHA